MTLLERLMWKLKGRRKREEDMKAFLADWKVLHIRNDELGQGFMARVRTARPQLPKGARFDTAVMIEWTYAEDGMPDQKTLAEMADFERRFDELTHDNGFSELVLVRTGLGRRNWLFYTTDQYKFMDRFKQCVSGRTFEVEVAIGEDPDWSMWQEFLSDLGAHTERSR